MIRRAVLAALLALGVAGPGHADDKPALTRVEVRDGRLHIAGDLDATTGPRVRAALAAHPEVDEVVLGRIPGSVDLDRTLELGRWLRAGGFDTYLTSDSAIFSGGVDLFLSGVRRRMEAGARIGVHAWSDANGQATDYGLTDRTHRNSRGYVRTMLGSDDFYWFAVKAAPASRIHTLTPKEIARYGLLTAPVIEPQGDD
ncbi:hypothetical protein JQC91_15675 [Jannaschia sp. Os4]|uniref:hypothetical protein n=1 Tax=Jannaschia sp. Os4 TaxID=2807617 RepID=UPI00193A3D80|nr:hypothetical protein [Jannaschia sp. Os4]MBM2577746.1 hypothetical protein [Jannaschia sp. Os4]